MRDPQGEWQGFEIDLARQLAADLGVDLTIVRMPFTQFTDRRWRPVSIDIVVAGYSITPQRALVVDFSNAYADSQMELVVRKDLAGQDVNRRRREDRRARGRRRRKRPLSARLSQSADRRVPRPSRGSTRQLKAGEVDGALAYTPRTTIAIAESEGRLAVATGIARTAAHGRGVCSAQGRAELC